MPTLDELKKQIEQNEKHALILSLVREAARAGDAYYNARKELAQALGLDENTDLGDTPRLFQIIEMTNPEDENDVEESGSVLIQEKASGELNA